MNPLLLLFNRLTKKKDSPLSQNLSWNQASILDSLALLTENAHLNNQLEEDRFQSFIEKINGLQQQLDQQSVEIKNLSLGQEPSELPSQLFDPTPKRLEFALACHLIATHRAENPAHETRVIDIGANRGVFTSMAHEIGAHVWAIEPNPELFEELSRNFADRNNVVCLPFAASDKSETADLFLVESTEAGPSDQDLTLFSSLIPHPMPAPFQFGATVEIEARTLDAMIEEKLLPASFFLLKIDTEGNEDRVMDGLALSAPEIISLEYWGDDLGFRNEDASPVSTLIQKLKARGYPLLLTLFQTPEMSWPVWEAGFSNSSRSYGNLFFFRDARHFTTATQWCHHLLDSASSPSEP